MRFGLFFTLSTPRPWTPASQKAVIDNALELAQTADELGFDEVWVAEHHFLEEYSHSSAPELFLTAVARRTKRVRIGHGIVTCVPQYDHPVRIAERAAVLDILSGGRLEFGTGRSATWTELGGFGADPDRTKAHWDEFVRLIPKIWTSERFRYESETFSIPERQVVPRPYQQPHPPMWVAVNSPGTELDAADRGLGSFGLTIGGYAAHERRVNEYRRRIRQCEPVGSFVNEQVSTVNFLYCHAEQEQAAKTGLRQAQTLGMMAAQFVSAKEAYPSTAYLQPGLLPQLRHSAGKGATPSVPEGLTVGDPHQVTEVIRQWESTGVDSMNFLVNCMETVPQEEVKESMRLFAAEVMPRFQVAAVPETALE